MGIDPSTVLTPAGLLVLIPLLVDVAKTAVFWSDGQARDRLTPPLALVIGVVLGLCAALAQGTDVATGGLTGLICGLTATYGYAKLKPLVKGTPAG